MKDKMNKIHNIDCLEFMKDVPDNYFDLVLTDPPYGINESGGKFRDRKGGGHRVLEKKHWDKETPSREVFEEIFRVSKNQIIWGGNYFGLKGGVIAWNKYGTAFGEGEIAICSTHNSVRFFNYAWNGMIQGNMKNKEHRIHVTQKPVALYKWLLKNYGFNKDGSKRTILDTHGGSMSIAIACHDMKFDLDLWELDEDYYKAGVKRYQQHISQLQLF